MGERCINYVGVTCVDGNCPVALFWGESRG